MFCPVDGMEWREGITRCPEHDVDLVEDPPEGYEDEYSDDEVTVLDRFGLEGAAGYTVVTIVVAAIVYAVSGVVAAGWSSLAVAREWREPGPFELVRFVNEGARAITLGGLGVLGAGLLGRGWIRLGPANEPGPGLPRSDDEDEGPAEASAGWVVTLLCSLVVVFVVVWAVTGVATTWDSLEVQREPVAPFDFEGPSDTFLTLSAVNNAAYYCALAAFSALGSMLMARAYDRIGRRR